MSCLGISSLKTGVGGNSFSTSRDRTEHESEGTLESRETKDPNICSVGLVLLKLVPSNCRRRPAIRSRNSASRGCWGIWSSREAKIHGAGPSWELWDGGSTPWISSDTVGDSGSTAWFSSGWKEPDGKGCSLGLMWWSVVLRRVRRVSSYCGLTIEVARQGKTGEEMKWVPTWDEYTGYITISFLHWDDTIFFERLIGKRSREGLYFVFSPFSFIVVQLAFFLHHEAVVSSENNDYGNWLLRPFRMDTQWPQLQDDSLLPWTTWKISSSTASRTRPPAKGVAMHNLRTFTLRSCV